VSRRVFVAGATGVIGSRLVPLLLDAGHAVAGSTRSRPAVVEKLGAEPVVCDVYDSVRLRDAIERFAPDVIVDQLTDLPDDRAELSASATANRRIRTEGTRNLLAAANGVRMIAQSTAFGASGVEEHEALVLAADGVVVRYGWLYGPGTWYDAERLPPTPRIHVDEAARRTVPTLTASPGSVLELIEAPT
jgi:hypothetical protein